MIWWLILSVLAALAVLVGGGAAWRVGRAPQPEAPAGDVPDVEQVTLAPYETATLAVLEDIYGDKHAARVAAQRGRAHAEQRDGEDA